MLNIISYALILKTVQNSFHFFHVYLCLIYVEVYGRVIHLKEREIITKYYSKKLTIHGGNYNHCIITTQGFCFVFSILFSMMH